MKVLFAFFGITSNSVAGIEAPVYVNVPIVVFAQIFGVTIQAGIVKFIDSVKKYVTSL